MHSAFRLVRAMDEARALLRLQECCTRLPDVFFLSDGKVKIRKTELKNWGARGVKTPAYHPILLLAGFEAYKGNPNKLCANKQARQWRAAYQELLRQLCEIQDLNDHHVKAFHKALKELWADLEGYYPSGVWVCLAKRVYATCMQCRQSHNHACMHAGVGSCLLIYDSSLPVNSRILCMLLDSRSLTRYTPAFCRAVLMIPCVSDHLNVVCMQMT